MCLAGILGHAEEKEEDKRSHHSNSAFKWSRAANKSLSDSTNREVFRDCDSGIGNKREENHLNILLHFVPHCESTLSYSVQVQENGFALEIIQFHVRQIKALSPTLPLSCIFNRLLQHPPTATKPEEFAIAAGELLLLRATLCAVFDL